MESTFGKLSIRFWVIGPTPFGVQHAGYVGVQVATFTSIEISPIAKSKSAKPTHVTSFGLGFVDSVELEARIRDENTAKFLRYVLEIVSALLPRLSFVIEDLK